MKRENNREIESEEQPLYSGFQLCEKLGTREKCFRLREYHEGIYIDKFHEYIPKHRISSDSSFQFMKSLLVKHSGIGDILILRSYINGRGKNPKKYPLCMGIVEFPEPGVMRTYCNSGNLHAWCDEVIDKSCFRTGKHEVEKNG